MDEYNKLDIAIFIAKIDKIIAKQDKYLAEEIEDCPPGPGLSMMMKSLVKARRVVASSIMDAVKQTKLTSDP